LQDLSASDKNNEIPQPGISASRLGFEPGTSHIRVKKSSMFLLACPELLLILANSRVFGPRKRQVTSPLERLFHYCLLWTSWAVLGLPIAMVNCSMFVLFITSSPLLLASSCNNDINETQLRNQPCKQNLLYASSSECYFL
jgi:hypothetical protein